MKNAVFLFDYTGIMATDWIKNNYKCWIVDSQHPEGITTEGNLVKVGADLLMGVPGCLPDKPDFVASFPPCTDVAISGARHFKGKGLRRFADSIHLFATASEYSESTGAPYMIQNPMSTI